MVIMLMENANDLGHHLTVLAKIHLFTAGQKSLLILANGSYWINLFDWIKINHLLSELDIPGSIF